MHSNGQTDVEGEPLRVRACASDGLWIATATPRQSDTRRAIDCAFCGLGPPFDPCKIKSNQFIR